MRTIEVTTRFRKDYKREAKGPHRKTLSVDFAEVVAMLATMCRFLSSSATMRLLVSGRTIATATSSRIWC